jgi:hypothetical protein
MENFAVPAALVSDLVKALVKARQADGLVPLSTVLRLKCDALALDDAARDRARKSFVRWGASALSRGRRRFVDCDAALLLLFGLSPLEAATVLGTTEGAMTGRLRPLLPAMEFGPKLAPIGGELARGVVGLMRRKAASGNVGRYLILIADPREGTALEAEALEAEAEEEKAEAEKIGGREGAWGRFGALKDRAASLRNALAPWEKGPALSA